MQSTVHSSRSLAARRQSDLPMSTFHWHYLLVPSFSWVPEPSYTNLHFHLPTHRTKQAKAQPPVKANSLPSPEQLKVGREKHTALWCCLTLHWWPQTSNRPQNPTALVFFHSLFTFSPWAPTHAFFSFRSCHSQLMTSTHFTQRVEVIRRELGYLPQPTTCSHPSFFTTAIASFRDWHNSLLWTLLPVSTQARPLTYKPFPRQEPEWTCKK